ncbi:hypothetical protein, partial [Klebsiella pneumoniae]|uniref:hypothetical protein n=1 Tax=Klebsiella pneumoniae TaxID=573 RepID=UPI001C400D70
MFRLCLFDLDNTLVHTDDLESLRLASKKPKGGSTPEPQKIPSFHIVNINRLIPAEECWSDVR